MFHQVIVEGFAKEWTRHTIASIQNSRDTRDPQNYKNIMIDHIMAKLYGAVLEAQLTSYKEIKGQCPGVVWKDSYATLGRFDVVDIVESKDIKQVERAAMIIRAYGHSTTETLVATPWREFLSNL